MAVGLGEAVSFAVRGALQLRQVDDGEGGLLARALLGADVHKVVYDVLADVQRVAMPGSAESLVSQLVF